MITFSVVRQLSGTFVRQNFRFFCCLPTVRHIRPEELSDLSGNPLTAYLPNYIILYLFRFVNPFAEFSSRLKRKCAICSTNHIYKQRLRRSEAFSVPFLGRVHALKVPHLFKLVVAPIFIKFPLNGRVHTLLKFPL